MTLRTDGCAVSILLLPNPILSRGLHTIDNGSLQLVYPKGTRNRREENLDLATMLDKFFHPKGTNSQKRIDRGA